MQDTAPCAAVGTTLPLSKASGCQVVRGHFDAAQHTPHLEAQV